MELLLCNVVNASPIWEPWRMDLNAVGTENVSFLSESLTESDSQGGYSHSHPLDARLTESSSWGHSTISWSLIGGLYRVPEDGSPSSQGVTSKLSPRG